MILNIYSMKGSRKTGYEFELFNSNDIRKPIKMSSILKKYLNTMFGLPNYEQYDREVSNSLKKFGKGIITIEFKNDDRPNNHLTNFSWRF